ncbi:MAG TPA: hypothetical protein VLH61_07220, partial [Bacteroidales bacterium]|nr:hypothetical protein [Bacteroidales bacterium]
MNIPKNSGGRFPKKHIRCRTNIFSLAAFWLLSLFVINPLLSQELKVITFNIRFDNPTDGINAWLNRIPMVKSYLHEAKADIVGVQEALHHQVLDLEKML